MNSSESKQIPQWLEILSRLATIVIALVAVLSALASVNFFVVRAVVIEEVTPRFQQVEDRLERIEIKLDELKN